jgi:threonine synthase
MPVDVLRCRVCGSEYPAVANGICSSCFGPLEPAYDWDELARTVSRESIEAGPASLWRYAPLLPASAGGDGLEPRLHAARARAAPRRLRSASARSCLKLDISNPTHSFKDRVVAVAAAKAQEFGLDTLSCTSTGNLAGAVAARAAALGCRR